MIVGDVNSDFTTNGGMISSKVAENFMTFFDSFTINYVVNYQSLVITSNPRDFKCPKTLELGISDHMLVYASITVKVKRPPPKIIRARTYNEFNKDNFHKDIQNVP